MKTKFHLPLMATVFLAGAMFFAGCEKENNVEKKDSEIHYLNLQGIVNAIVDPCHGGVIVIDINNIDSIGQTQGCFKCCSETVYYHNSIMIPSFCSYKNGTLKYQVKGAEYLKELNAGSSISMKCRPATHDDDSLFWVDVLCTANHYPVDCPKYIVESINYVKND